MPYSKKRIFSKGMRAVFVTGTDTGVGKTIVSGLLARFLALKGKKVITQKWIQTGSEESCSDIAMHLKLMGKRKKQIAKYLPFMCPYTFKLASSPHLAAREERINIRIDKIKKSFKYLASIFDFVIVEGIGGALVPLNRKKFLIDIAKELGIPVIIVAANKLGAINHTLLTIEAIKVRKLRSLGVVFNSCQRQSNNVITRDNPKVIKNFSREDILGELVWNKEKKNLYKSFEPIAKKILSKLVR